jgi:hypothetical protein
VHHERSKHIDVRFHSIREHIKNEKIRVVHVQSNDQAVDIFTKALPNTLFGMKEIRDERDEGNSRLELKGGCWKL